MAFSLAQAWINNSAGSGTTVSVTLSTVPTTGNLLVAFYQCENALTASIADTIGDGVGWTVLLSAIPDSISVGKSYCAYKIVGTPSGGAKNVTITTSGGISGGAGIMVAAYAATGAITADGTPTHAANQSAVSDPGAITTTGAAGLVLGFDSDNGATQVSTGSGFTMRLTGAGGVFSNAISDRYTTSAGSYDPTWSTGASNFWSAFAVAFKQAGGGAPPARHYLKYLEAVGILSFAAALGASLFLTWQLPTKNADGSAIGTITGQTIYYDTVPRMGTGVAYANSVAVGNGTSTSASLAGLAHLTTYYYALTVTVAGVESDYSTENFQTTT